MTATKEIAVSLVALGLASDPAALAFTPLTGGVSSDIWCVRGGHAPLCVKRARSQLAVEAKWEVAVERNHFEAEFLRVVELEVPGLAPALLAEDESQGFIVLPYLDPSEWQLWKPQLLAGHVDSAVAEAVGTHLGKLARVTRDRPELLQQFDTTGLFHALRLDPYILECARRHPDLAPALTALADATAARRESLVHGDVSPKNILAGRSSSAVVLDAECAWYGDPAFDLAFVLNHLLLKSVHRPDAAADLWAAMQTLMEARAAADAPEHAEAVQRRATALLPALLLARVDGKSPVEYLVDPKKKDAIRAVAGRFLRDPPTYTYDIVSALIGDQDNEQ